MSDESYEISTIVVDPGSFETKFGFADSAASVRSFETVIGRHSAATRPMLGMGVRDCYVGKDALARSDLTYRYPIEHGMVTNFDDFEKSMHHTFYNELRAAPEEHPTVLTEPPMNPTKNREKLTQIFFETFSVPAFFLVSTSYCVLQAANVATGVVVNVGDGAANVVPFHEGNRIVSAIQNGSVRGCDLTAYLAKLLAENRGGGFTCSTLEEKALLRQKKHELCYVSQNFDADMSTARWFDGVNRSFSIGSRQLTLGAERFQCAEPLFRPSLIGVEHTSLQQQVSTAIEGCDSEIRDDLYREIIVDGGSTQFDGFIERLEHEVRSTLSLPSATRVIVKRATKQHSAWHGAAKLSKSPFFAERWVSKEHYDEYGPNISKLKCLD